MAVSVFHTDARGYGILSSIMAIGTVTGALLGARREQPRFPLLLVGAAVFGLGCALAAIAPGYWFFAGALVVIGVAALTFTNTTNSLMQLSAKPAMRGRVMPPRDPGGC
jgi:predicted MFS family arabinose efflux permease